MLTSMRQQPSHGDHEAAMKSRGGAHNLYETGGCPWPSLPSSVAKDIEREVEQGDAGTSRIAIGLIMGAMNSAL